jgi:post-segregation antitoxin (ccd killing protein)
MQVYLPDDLYKLVKTGHLRASELLQQAVRAEARRLKILRETDKYVADLASQVGHPDARQRARAKAIAQRVVEHRRRKAS